MQAVEIACCLPQSKDGWHSLSLIFPHDDCTIAANPAEQGLEAGLELEVPLPKKNIWRVFLKASGFPLDEPKRVTVTATKTGPLIYCP